MKIVIITQDEPFYLKSNLEHLIKILPNGAKIVGCVVNEASPFGKKENFFSKILKPTMFLALIFFYIIQLNT